MCAVPVLDGKAHELDPMQLVTYGSELLKTIAVLFSFSGISINFYNLAAAECYKLLAVSGGASFLNVMRNTLFLDYV